MAIELRGRDEIGGRDKLNQRVGPGGTVCFWINQIYQQVMRCSVSIKLRLRDESGGRDNLNQRVGPGGTVCF